jgi:hypothetical protein
MAKDELIKSATDIWCSYGQAINKTFEFNGFLIESTPLEIALNSNSDEQIIRFIEYVKSQIELLQTK